MFVTAYHRLVLYNIMYLLWGFCLHEDAPVHCCQAVSEQTVVHVARPASPRNQTPWHWVEGAQRHHVHVAGEPSGRVRMASHNCVHKYHISRIFFSFSEFLFNRQFHISQAERTARSHRYKTVDSCLYLYVVLMQFFNNVFFFFFLTQAVGALSAEVLPDLCEWPPWPAVQHWSRRRSQTAGLPGWVQPTQWHPTLHCKPGECCTDAVLVCHHEKVCAALTVRLLSGGP